MEAEPTDYLTNQPDRDRAFITAKTIVNDPGQGRFASATLAGNDIDHVRFECDDTGTMARVFRPKNDFQDREFHRFAPMSLNFRIECSSGCKFAPASSHQRHD